jgi:magnesium transporter
MDSTPDSRLEDVVAEVHRLLRKHRPLEDVARRQQTPRNALLEEMQHRQNLVELQRRVRILHPADIAKLLESLPLEDRLIVWAELTARLAGPALVEVSPEVRASLSRTRRGSA